MGLLGEFPKEEIKQKEQKTYQKFDQDNKKHLPYGVVFSEHTHPFLYSAHEEILL